MLSMLSKLCRLSMICSLSVLRKLCKLSVWRTLSMLSSEDGRTGRERDDRSGLDGGAWGRKGESLTYGM